MKLLKNYFASFAHLSFSVGGFVSIFSIFIFHSSVFAQAQVLYGMTAFGGSADSGTIIMFNPNTNKESVVWSFKGSPSDGTDPESDITYDPNNGLFYGMTSSGGENNAGIIFSFNPVTNAEKILWNFGNGKDGTSPYSDLVYDDNYQLFYGTTDAGGTYGGGVIFSFSPATDSENVLWNFGNGTDGSEPGTLFYCIDNGLYYGMTSTGGVKGAGTIICLDPYTNAETLLWSFGSDSDGVLPSGTFVYDEGTRLLYGMTNLGGPNRGGTIVSFDPFSDTEAVVWYFGSGNDGTSAYGSLAYNPNDGLYYGTTTYGGGGGGGTIISFNPSDDSEKVLWNFAGPPGGFTPVGNLTFMPSNGLFYGTAPDGGIDNGGTIFNFNPVTGSDSTLWNFGNGTDGYGPWASFVSYTPAIGTDIKTISKTSLNIFPNPTDCQITIDGLSDGQTLEVYNFAGQKINSMIAENCTEQVNLSALASGVYFIRVLNSDGSSSEQKKIVKIN